MSSSAAQAYSALPYPNHCFAEMHPDRMAVIATLFGLQPAHPARCRMLELGCGAGGSLIPFAHALPGSAFLGIDITPGAIESAQRSAGKLGLRNIEFRCADILDLEKSALGAFDYIAAHGVYSWVPDEVRQAILRLCRAHLAPHGVAYISYNARPGSDLRTLLRDILLFHCSQAESPAERVRQGRAVAQFLAEAKAGNEMYTRVLEWNRERIARLSDELLFHDDLGSVNHPFYFHEFVRQAAAHELQYLGEADFFSMTERRFEPRVREQLEKLGGNLLTAEQYMDFLAGRAFRETLLCHKAAPVSRTVTGERVRQMWIASPLEPVSSSPRIVTDDAEEFRPPGAEDRSISTNHRMAKAMLFELYRAFPACLTFSALYARVREHVTNASEEALANGILETYATGPAIEVRVEPPRCASSIVERPQLSPVARLQLEAGAPVVTNLRAHQVDASNPLVRHMLTLADGSRTRGELLDGLVAAVESGAVPAPEGAAGASSTLLESLAAGLDANLRMATRRSLFVGDG